jgi:hypothetical protein
MFEGKTLFQYYVLVRLLQQKQVVLFLSRSGQDLYLFYHDGVHTIPTASLKDASLPRPSTLLSDVFIWSLFDIPERNEPNTLLVFPPCVPVQTTSPDPCRYKTWDKQRSPLFTALPLWTRDELARGYVFPTSSFSPHLRTHDLDYDIRNITNPCWTRFNRYVKASSSPSVIH